jgi:hypothetical protein
MYAVATSSTRSLRAFDQSGPRRRLRAFKVTTDRVSGASAP